MGGRGSGRWRGLKVKTTVEECAFMDINAIRREGFKDKGKAPIFVKTRKAIKRKTIGLIEYEMRSTRDHSPVILLKYSVKREGDLQQVEDQIILQSTQPFFGGSRWWFTCPHTKGNHHCERRVGILYLPPGSLYFGCRHCYDLTYRCCQESHKRNFLADLFLKRIYEITAEQAINISNLIGF